MHAYTHTHTPTTDAHTPLLTNLQEDMELAVVKRTFSSLFDIDAKTSFTILMHLIATGDEPVLREKVRNSLLGPKYSAIGPTGTVSYVLF